MIDLGLNITSVALRNSRRGIESLNPKVWLDPSDLRTLFQDPAGTIPVTGSAQPVAYVTDKSRHGHHAVQNVSDQNRPTLARHPASGLRQNLNGTSDFSGWQFAGSGAGSCVLGVDATVAPDGSQTAARLAFSAANQIFRHSLNPLPSGDYVGSVWIKGAAAETIRCRLSGSTEFTHTLNGDWQEVSGSVVGGSPTSFNVGTWAGVTARVVEVWHPQHEAGLAKTPYQKRVNQFDVTEAGERDIWYISGDLVDDELVVSLPDFGAGVTEFWADENGVTINGAQTIGAGEKALPGSARLYSYGIFDRALSEPETAQLRKFLEMRSGTSTSST
ncbi:hypothetical protein [Ruegeria sp. Ofav3-42]|uniref:phage head spike fiber domain-containing protein n=1 Tax=Ruegeria sp. Ofav3-42 TaxID=2917759 RepID=UPI001EF4800A|nr:hypothetical protein [Ruegeria sp. Ofav3-42]MCG7522712.1 hypothetical protein [Ruegeria sp. Ofav3-42]